ncbi:MAG: SpoIIE family protein phosphatase, partial [Bacteroidia bacterium]|nr:SpoIIE family protein phosphatase [Bacteroidia bacterium]
ACDCTGHGVPGALVSVVCSNALNRAVKEFHITEPGKILDKVRELVLETFDKSEGNIQDGMDISLLAISGVNAPSLSWSGAYNPLWVASNGKISELEGDKQPIGKSDNPKPFTTHTITLNPLPGGCGAVYLFTDGFADQFGGPKGKKFKYKQLQEKLLAISHRPLAEQKAELEKEFENWKGALEQTDDVCVIGIRI